MTHDQTTGRIVPTSSYDRQAMSVLAIDGIRFDILIAPRFVRHVPSDWTRHDTGDAIVSDDGTIRVEYIDPDQPQDAAVAYQWTATVFAHFEPQPHMPDRLGLVIDAIQSSGPVAAEPSHFVSAPAAPDDEP